MSILNADVNLCSIFNFLTKKTQVLILFSIFASFKQFSGADAPKERYLPLYGCGTGNSRNASKLA